ncbi:hypothetical protein LQV63_17245 [Paenibacillus profundus]|uniref:Uncharacterized protein n=1 Tax=Paenibacillus profundus TaxID=1173085 RepID=A0ABS8YJB8_9BACL|nr:hypothetical protein [Paenibacillus profundus]
MQGGDAERPISVIACAAGSAAISRLMVCIGEQVILLIEEEELMNAFADGCGA